MILEELVDANAVLFHNLFHFEHQWFNASLAGEVNKSVSEGRLGSSCVAIDHVLEAVGVLQELLVFDVVVLVTVDESHSVHLVLIDLKSQGVKHLAEDLRGDLEGAQSVSILEEALGVKAVLTDDLSEVLNDLLTKSALLGISLASSVDSIDASITDSDIRVPLEALSGEDLVNLVRELSPLNVLTLLWRLEMSAKELELTVRDGHLCHIQTDAELGGSDVARA